MSVTVWDEAAIATSLEGGPATAVGELIADGPREFCWQGRVHRVRGILSHRRVSNEVWRVTASAAPVGHTGVFDMRLDWNTGQWTIRRVRVLRGVVGTTLPLEESS